MTRRNNRIYHTWKDGDVVRVAVSRDEGKSWKRFSRTFPVTMKRKTVLKRVERELKKEEKSRVAH